MKNICAIFAMIAIASDVTVGAHAAGKKESKKGHWTFAECRNLVIASGKYNGDARGGTQAARRCMRMGPKSI